MRKNDLLERGAQQLCLYPALKLCIAGSEQTIDDAIAEENLGARESKPRLPKSAVLVICFFGLNINYLSWGILQEKIMTRTYQDSTGKTSQ